MFFSSHFQLCEDIFIQLESLQKATKMVQIFLLLLRSTTKLYLTLLNGPNVVYTKVFWF